jgi:hypothetical protein
MVTFESLRKARRSQANLVRVIALSAVSFEESAQRNKNLFDFISLSVSWWSNLSETTKACKTNLIPADER